MLTLVCMAGTRMCAVVFAVVRLNEPHAVKYGLCLNIDDKYRDLKKQLSVLCGVPASRLLLVEVYEKLVRVNLRDFIIIIIIIPITIIIMIMI